MAQAFVGSVVHLACDDYIERMQDCVRVAIDARTFAKFILQRLVPVFFPPLGTPATDILKYLPSVNADQPDKLLVQWKTDKHSVRFTVSGVPGRRFVIEEVDGEAIPADQSTFSIENEAVRFIIERAQAAK